MNILPCNSTKAEVDICEALNYDVNANILCSFKGSLDNVNNSLKIALSWEFSLSNIKIDDFNKKVLDGFEFHRYCGTPYALKTALFWYGIEDPKIEEEEVGKHFHEFQVGFNEIPDGMKIESVVTAAAFAKPLRSKLARMYNTDFDVRRFILDGSKFGDILSDYSGIRLSPDSPKLSFGRRKTFDAVWGRVNIRAKIEREYSCKATNDDRYLLDFAILDETASTRKENNLSMERVYSCRNSDCIGDDAEVIHPVTTAKSTFILSDSKLDGEQVMSPGAYDEIEGAITTLDFSNLSQQTRKTKHIFIDERLYVERWFSTHYGFGCAASNLIIWREYADHAINTGSGTNISVEKGTSLAARFEMNPDVERSQTPQYAMEYPGRCVFNFIKKAVSRF